MKISIHKLFELREHMIREGAQISDYCYPWLGEVGFYWTKKNPMTGLFQEGAYYSLPFGYLKREDNFFKKENEFMFSLNEHKNHLSFYCKAEPNMKSECVGFICIHSNICGRFLIHALAAHDEQLKIFLDESMGNKLIRDPSKSFIDVAMDDRYQILR